MPPRTQAFPIPQLRATEAAGSTLRRARRLKGLPAAQRILGVDPGLHRTGYGVVELIENSNRRGSGPMRMPSTGSSLKLIEGGVIRAKANDELPVRLNALYEGLLEVLSEHTPDVVVIEDLFSVYAHPRSALLMAHGRGVLMLAAAHAKVPVHSFQPNEVKQVVAGNGHATKSAMQAAVQSRLRLSAPPHPPDVADALALAICFTLRQSMNENLSG